MDVVTESFAADAKAWSSGIEMLVGLEPICDGICISADFRDFSDEPLPSKLTGISGVSSRD